MALELDVERREPLPEGTECYQVDDGTIFHYKYTGQRLLCISAKWPLANVLFNDIVQIVTHGNAIYFTTTQGQLNLTSATQLILQNISQYIFSIYRATATEADTLEVEFVRDLDEHDSVDTSGLCCRTDAWKRFIYPMHEDPRSRNYIFELPCDRRNGGALKGIHRDTLIYLKSGSTSGIRSLSTLAIQITLPIVESNSKLFAPNTSPLIFISNGDHLHVFNTNPMEPLRILEFSGFSGISIVGVHKEVITVSGRKGRRCYLARARIPEDYLSHCSSDEAYSWMPDDYNPGAILEQTSLETESSATINDLLDRNGQLAQEIADFKHSTVENDKEQLPCPIINRMKQLEKVKTQQEIENEEIRATLKRVSSRNIELAAANALLNQNKQLLIKEEEEVENRMLSTIEKLLEKQSQLERKQDRIASLKVEVSSVSMKKTNNAKSRFDSLKAMNENEILDANLLVMQSMHSK